MSEFAPICIYLVISLLVSLIPLGLTVLKMSKKSRIGKHLLYSFLLLLTFLSMCCLLCLYLEQMDFFYLNISKALISLGCRALSFALWKLGLPGGLAWSIGFGARVLITKEASDIMGHQMMPAGSDSSNSDSESWKKSLLNSPHPEGEGKGNSEAEPASRTRSSDPREDVGPSSVRRRVDAPETSTSSGWSGSWIERWFNQGETSSAPGDGQQPQGEVDQPTTTAMGEEAPDPTWLKIHIERIFYIIKGRKPQKRVLAELYEDLKLETASPQKRLQIMQILDQMKLDGRLKGREFKLNLELGNRIYDWEREQRHFPNPVDDIP
ncbi:uncharacterized protein LOC114757210 [Neltuma alba]|uniref:uncharacterized protein LOC114757210 n=1 Tax=Neltuma alba TaxID=207710 RepID=UPI0010A4326A|nr:uncharacterized protein LOC114757210 [Prosopis alba]